MWVLSDRSTWRTMDAAVQGLEDPQLIFQAVPAELSGRRFASPSTGMRVHFLPRRARFNVASSFASATSGSGDSGGSGNGRMMPLKLRHLLNLPSQTGMVSLMSSPHCPTQAHGGVLPHIWALE